MHGLSDKVLLNLPDTVLCSAAGTAAPIACLPSFLDRFAGGIVGSVSHVQVCTAPHACRAPKPQLRPQATSMAEEDIWVTTTHDSLSRSPARLSPHTAAPTRRPSSIPPHATCVIVSVCTMKRRQAGRPSRTFSRIIFIPSLTPLRREPRSHGRPGFCLSPNFDVNVTTVRRILDSIPEQ